MEVVLYLSQWHIWFNNIHETHCCISMATVFMQMCLNVILYIICLLILSSHLYPGHQRDFFFKVSNWNFMCLSHFSWAWYTSWQSRHLLDLNVVVACVEKCVLWSSSFCNFFKSVPAVIGPCVFQMVMFSYIHISCLGLKTPRFCNRMKKVRNNPGNILNMWMSVAYRGVQNPLPLPEIPKALQNRAKLNLIVKTVKNCWI